MTLRRLWCQLAGTSLHPLGRFSGVDRAGIVNTLTLLRKNSPYTSGVCCSAYFISLQPRTSNSIRIADELKGFKVFYLAEAHFTGIEAVSA